MTETLSGDMMGKKSVPILHGKMICKIGTIESNTCLIPPPLPQGGGRGEEALRTEKLVGRGGSDKLKITFIKNNNTYSK